MHCGIALIESSGGYSKCHGILHNSAEGGGDEGDEGPDSVEVVVGSWIDNDMVKGFVTTNMDLFLTLMKVRVIKLI